MPAVFDDVQGAAAQPRNPGLTNLSSTAGQPKDDAPAGGASFDTTEGGVFDKQQPVEKTGAQFDSPVTQEPLTNDQLRAKFEEEDAKNYPQKALDVAKSAASTAGSLAKRFAWDMPAEDIQAAQDAFNQPGTVFDKLDYLGRRALKTWTDAKSDAVRSLGTMAGDIVGKPIESFINDPVGHIASLAAGPLAPAAYSVVHNATTDKEQRWQEFQQNYFRTLAEQQAAAAPPAQPGTPEWAATNIEPLSGMAQAVLDKFHGNEVEGLPITKEALSNVMQLVGPEAVMSLSSKAVTAVDSAMRAGKIAEAQQIAGDALAKTGSVVKSAATLPKTMLSKMAEGVLGEGESAEKIADAIEKVSVPLAVATGTAKLPAALKVAEKAGESAEQIGSAISTLARQDPNSIWGKAFAAAKDEDAPSWMKKMFTNPITGKLAQRGGEAAADLAKGAAGGAAFGAGYGAVTGQNPEDLGASIGGGAVLGAGTRLAHLPSLHNDRILERAGEASQELYRQHLEEGIDPASLKNVPSSAWTQAAAIQQGLGVKVRFVNRGEFDNLKTKEGSQMAPAGADGVWDDQSRTIFLNSNARSLSGNLLHEASHPLFDDMVARHPEISDVVDRSLAAKGQTINDMKRTYVEALMRNDLPGLDHQTAERLINNQIDARDAANPGWAYSEVLAENFRNTLKEKQLLRLDPTVSGFLSDTLNRIFNNGAEPTDPATGFFKGYSNVIRSPELTNLGRKLLKTRQEFRPGVDELGGNEGVKLSPEQFGKRREAPLSQQQDGQMGSNSGMVVATPSGNKFRSPSAIRKILRDRVAAVRDLFKSTEKNPKPYGDTSPEVAHRRTTNGVEISGTQLPQDWNRAGAYSKDTENIARVIQDAIDNGKTLGSWYHQIGTSMGKGSWASVVRKQLGAFVAKYHDYQPFGWLADKQGNLHTRVFDRNALNQRLSDWQNRKGILSLEQWGGDKGAALADIKTYLDNHSKGLAGETGLTPEKKNVINAILAGRNAEFEGSNPLRAQLKGKDRQGIVRDFRLDRLETVEPSQQSNITRPDYGKLKGNFTPEDEQHGWQNPRGNRFPLNPGQTYEQWAREQTGIKPVDIPDKALADKLAKVAGTEMLKWQGWKQFTPSEEMDALAKSSPEDYRRFVDAFTGPYGAKQTGWSFHLGSRLTTPDELQRLRGLRTQLLDEAKVAQKSGDFNSAFLNMSKAQAMREAYEAATGVTMEGTPNPGSLSMIRKSHPDYQPPLEGGEPAFTGAATPNTDEDYKLKPAGTSLVSKAWILPDGKPVQLGSQWHHDWLNNNPKVAKKYGLKTTTSGEENRIDALKKGFVRVNYEARTGKMTVEARAKDWPNVAGSVKKMVETNLKQVDHITVHLFDDKVRSIKDSGTQALFDLPEDERMDKIPFLSAPGETTEMSAQATPRNERMQTGSFTPISPDPDVIPDIGPVEAKKEQPEAYWKRVAGMVGAASHPDWFKGVGGTEGLVEMADKIAKGEVTESDRRTDARADALFDMDSSLQQISKNWEPTRTQLSTASWRIGDAATIRRSLAMRYGMKTADEVLKQADRKGVFQRLFGKNEKSAWEKKQEAKENTPDETFNPPSPWDKPSTGTYSPKVDEDAEEPPVKPIDEKTATRSAARVVREIGDKAKAGQKATGLTFNVARGRVMEFGYSAPLYPDLTEKLPASSSPAEVRKAVSTYIQKNAELLQNPRLSFGYWNDGEGTIWFDVTAVLPHQDIAEFAGKKYNQVGIGDLQAYAAGKDGFIGTGGNGEAPKDMLPASERLNALNKEYRASIHEPIIQGAVTQARPEESAPVPRNRPRNPKENEALSLDTVLRNPDMDDYAKAVVERFKTNVPGFQNIDSDDTHAALHEISNRLEQNIKFFYDQATPAERDEWRRWYDIISKMSKDWGAEFGLDWHQVAAINAAFSPQTPWDMNVTLTRRVLTTLKENPELTQREKDYMSKQIKTYLGKKKKLNVELSDLKENVAKMKPGTKLSDMTDTQAGVFLRVHQQATNKPLMTHDHNLEPTKGEDKLTAWMIDWPDLKKIVSIYRDGSRENVNDRLGWNHKVRSFYNNHVAPEDPRWVTVDTHAMAAATLLPLGSSDAATKDGFGNVSHKAAGYNGTYFLYQHAYQQVAKQLGILPRELQSIVWEKARRSLTDVAKRDLQANPEPIQAIHKDIDEGRMTPEEGRMAILNLYHEHSGLSDNDTGGESKEAAPTESEPF